MRLRHLPLALAAASLVTAPALAAPGNPAASLSVAKSARAATPAGKSSALQGGGTYAALGFLAFVAAVVIIKEVADDSDSN